MKRRDFIALIGGAAAWPLGASAQQDTRIRRIGVLTGSAENEYQDRFTAFQQELERLGWTNGHNIRIDYRRGVAGDPDRRRRAALELVSAAPDVILATGSPNVAMLQHATRTIPIIFVATADPVGAGFVASLARPAGNITGFTPFEYGISVKWLELLTQIAPGVKHVAVLRDPVSPTGIGFFGAMQGIAPSLRVNLRPIGVRDAGEIERAIEAFASEPSGGLIVTTSALTYAHHKLISALAAWHKLPAVYPYRFFVTGGGLISYGSDEIDHYRRAAGYVDRILKGEKPGDLPVQAPTRYELVINLKTAKALGLDVPQSLLARADEVIE